MGLVDMWWVSRQVWASQGKALLFTFTSLPGGLLQEAQVQHSSRCPTEERGQVEAADTKGRSWSLDNQYLTGPFHPGACVFTPALLPPIPM